MNTVSHKYSDICDGWKGFDFNQCEFAKSASFSAVCWKNGVLCESFWFCVIDFRFAFSKHFHEIFLSWDYLMFVIVTLTFVMLRKLQYCMWVQIKLSHFNRLRNGVLCFFSGVVSRVVGLLFLIILVKFVFKRLPDVYRSYSDICDGWKDFDFVVCVFRSSFPFSLTEKRCCCVNGVDRVSLFCFFNHLVETCGWKINWSLPQFFWQL